METEQRIAYLDGWRGAAILGVLIDHFIKTRFLNLGRFGVEMFFVLSGILMADILFVRKKRLRDFFPRRFSRTYPALLLFATTLFLAAQLSHLFHISPLAYLSAITSTTNYYSIYVERTPVFDHIWSLSIEEQTYLFLGIVAWSSRRFAFNPLIPIIAGALFGFANGAIHTFIFHENYYATYWRTDVRGASILVGAVTYLIFNSAENRLNRIHDGYVATLGILAILFSSDYLPDPVKYTAGTVFLAISLVLLHESPRGVMAFFSSRVMVAIGTISYSLYLWQQPFGKLLRHTEKIAALPLVFLIAWASYRFVERPARAYLNNLWTKAESALSGRFEKTMAPKEV